MNTWTGPRELLRDPPPTPRVRPARARPARARRALTASLALALGVSGLGSATAATEVTQRNPGGLVAVGPVNTEHGYPAWYEDSAQVRTELCLDAGNPLCGFLPGDVPDPTQPISFPGNFPSEAFYMLAGSELELPGGGRAVLVLALEAAFANENPVPGDQVVFARQRVTVRGAPPDTTLTFTHPYGTVTVDTDEEGEGKIVEDVSPAIGNFQTPLKGDIGPFLRWDSGAPEGYLGNPDVEHTITGSPLGQNHFSVTGGGLDLRTDLFTVMGKISTNTGVQADRAVLGDGYVDVFATSRGDQLQVEGQDGVLATTPMEKEEGDSERAYARIAYTGTAPASVTVTNLGDDPVSRSEVPVTDVSVATAATYDGTALSVEAVSSSGAVPEVAGFGALDPVLDRPNTYRGAFPTVAPPVEVTVATSETSRTTVPVLVTGGEASPVGEAPVDPQPDPGPDPGDTTPDNPDAGEAPGAVASIAALPGSVVRGVPTELDGSASPNAVSYEWSQVSGPAVAFSSTTDARPRVTVPLFTTVGAASPSAPDADPVLQLVVTNAAGVAGEPARITLPSDDEVTVAAASRHRPGKELRISGTAVVPGAPTLLNPATTVNVYDTTSGSAVKLGTAQVDSLGNWEFRVKPGPSRRVSTVLVQSSRGGQAEGVVGTG